MYLIKVTMPMQQAYHLLADCQKMHRFVTGLFGTDRSTSKILYRTKNNQQTLSIYIYANRPVDPASCRHKIEQKDITAWLNSMQTGQYLGFDLVVSPSKKKGNGGVSLSQRRILRTPQERMEWLNRKAAEGGFTIVHATEQGDSHICGKHEADKGGVMHHASYHYQGALCITDAAAFRHALQNGIGPGKAYGLGMMMVKAL